MHPTAPTELRPSPHREARALIDEGRIDLVTCDVFDTLVWRAVASPRDQFLHVARHLRQAGLLAEHVNDEDFAGGRVLAERLVREDVRRASGHLEVTFEEIWERMPAAWRLDPDLTRYATAELEVEGGLLRLHTDTIDLLRHARSNGVPVTLVSDIYLSSAQLTQLLRAGSVPDELLEHVITSSDHRLGKAGGLLGRVIERSGVARDRVIHLGDNPISDVAAARSEGVVALATDMPPDERLAPGVLTELQGYSATHGTDGGTSGAIRTTLVRAGVVMEHQRPAYQFGAELGGPVLGGFAAWAVDTAEGLGVDRIHYLLREGAFVAELAAILRPDGPASSLVHASRWVNMRAAVFEGTAYEIARAVLRRATLRAEHVTECFGVPLADVVQVIGTGEIPDDRRWGAFEALADDDGIRSAIVDASAEVRARMVAYLREHVRPTGVDGRDRVVVCDIGWGGTIQEGLSAVLHHEGWDVDVIGLYLLLSEPGVSRVEQGAAMRSYLPVRGPHATNAAIVSRNPELLEELCTPPLGTLVDLAPDGSPVLADVPDHAPASRADARRAIVDYVRVAAELGLLRPGDPLLDDVEARGALLAGVTRTLQAPDPRLARELSTWSHDDVAGTAPEALVAGTLRRALPHLDAATAQGVTMRELFWMPGAAATGNPVLAAQLDAVQRGVDAEALSPPSGLGEALIAVYEPGESDATVLVETVPRVGAHGWSLLRVQGSLLGARDVRVDFGDTRGLVQLAYLELRLSCSDPDETVVIDVVRVDDARLRWADARPAGPDVVEVGPEGHLVMAIDPAVGRRSHHVAVQCAFRAWPDATLDAPLATLGSSVVRRARRGARRLTVALRRAARRR